MGRFDKYVTGQTGSAGRFDKYVSQNQEREKIVDAYAQDILRRQEIYGGLPAEKLKDPATLYALAEREAEREGWKIPETQKQDRLSSFVLGYGQGGTFGFADELSGAVDFVGGAGSGLLRGEGLGAIESGKQAYSKRVEADRRLMRQARIDNPVTTVAGEITGGVVTTAPAPVGLVGGGARTTAQVAAQAAAKADKLADLSQTGARFLSANRAARATNLSTKAAALSRPAANLGEQAARFGGRVAEATGKGFGYGAAYGGLYGMGTAEGGIPERLDETARGAAIGAIGGAVLTPAMQFVVAPIVGKAGYSLFTSLDNKALDKVLQRAERSGTSLQKVRADFDAWAKTGEVPETLAELMGPNERSLLSAMITVNRETEERAGNILLGRGKKEVDRLEKSFARAMGAGRGDFASARAGAQKARREDPTPLYDAAHYGPNGALKPLDPNKQAALNNILIDEDDVLTILKDAKADLNRSGNKGARDEIVRYMAAMQDLRAGNPAQIPNLSVQAADYIERAINDAFKSAGAGTGKISGGVRGWGMLRDAVRNIIDDTGVGAARATAAERIRRGELLEEGRDFLKPGVDIEDITDTLRGNPVLGIDPASPAGRQAYTMGAARAIGDKLRETQNMKGFADATRQIARTPAIREKVSAVLPQGKLTKKGVPSKRSKQSRLNTELEQAIERTAARADFTNTMLGNSRTAFRQGAVDDALADDQLSVAIGEGVRDLLMGGVGNVAQQAIGKFAKGAGARFGQPGIMRPGLNRKMADILLATDKDIPVQIQRLAARAAQRANGRSRGLPPAVGGGTAASGFAPALRTDLGNAGAGALGGGIMPLPSTGDPQEDMRNRMGAVLGGAAVGFGARRFGSRGAGARPQGVGAPTTPQQAARAELPGSPEYEAAKAKGLDMSQAGRMARAKEMGFDTDTVLYHGTDEKFDAFEAGRRDPGVWMTTYKMNAASYAKGADAQLHYLYIRPGKTLTINAKEKGKEIVFESSDVDVDMSDWTNVDAANYAQRNGYDTLVFPNGNKTEADYTAVVFNPANIRDIDAAFDPDNAASPILTAGLGGGGNPLEALAEPGRRIAGMLRSIDRGLRPATDPRVIQPTIAAGNMKRPKTGQAALEAMRNPEATIPAMSNAARRAEDASTFEFMRQNQISSAGQNNAQAIQGYRNNLQSRADAAPNANRLAETAAVEIKQAQQQAQKLHGDLVDAIIADNPQAQRMAAESLAGVKMQIEMMKRNAPKKQRENLDRVISIIDVAVAEGMKARQQPGYVARTLAGPGLKKLRRDGETLALLTDPARAKDAYRVANEVKPLGSWEKTGQATALGATVGAGALVYDQTKKAEARKQEDYYARRDAWDVKNKHVDNYAPKKLEDVQSFLNAVVPPEEDERDLVIDGRWGENTSRRIKRYQKMRGLTVNGRLTWETITDLEAEMNAVQR
jgi:peptidoglycan hydrolase-like protein with peptidoglycan-binding domain